MAITLRGSTGTSNTISLPVTTNAGDLIIIGDNGTNSFRNSISSPPALTGGTCSWALFIVSQAGYTHCAVWIGYNCSAGITAANTGGTQGIAVYSGCSTSAPTLVETVDQEAGGVSATTPSISYGATDMVIGYGAAYSLSNNTTSWSNGSVSTLVCDLSTLAHALVVATIIPGSAGSTTFTTPANTNSWVVGETIVINALSSGPAFIASSPIVVSQAVNRASRY